MNATFEADDSPEYEKARAVIEKYLDLVDNADAGSEEDGIKPMRGNDVAHHIDMYDLTDRLQHAAAMLDKIVGMGEGLGRELGDTPRDNLIKRLSPTIMDEKTLMKSVAKVINSPEFTSDTVLKIVDAGSSITHPVGKFIQKEFDELQYDLGRKYEDMPEEVAEQLIVQLKRRTKEYVGESTEKRAPAKKQERNVELPSGAKVKATKVQGWQSQKADKEAKKDESISKEVKRKAKKVVAESYEPKLTFREMIKLVQESGGQQAIDPLDKELFVWASRVAKQKLGENMKAEVYAGMVYERMGGVFNMYDVLSENKK
jgi:Skp family chaperone for outer membrane proteins